MVTLFGEQEQAQEGVAKVIKAMQEMAWTRHVSTFKAGVTRTAADLERPLKIMAKRKKEVEGASLLLGVLVEQLAEEGGEGVAGTVRKAGKAVLGLIGVGGGDDVVGLRLAKLLCDMLPSQGRAVGWVVQRKELGLGYGGGGGRGGLGAAEKRTQWRKQKVDLWEAKKKQLVEAEKEASPFASLRKLKSTVDQFMDSVLNEESKRMKEVRAFFFTSSLLFLTNAHARCRSKTLRTCPRVTSSF